MNTRTARTWKRLVASVTSALVVALSVVVPLLDGGPGFEGPVFEADHHGSACVVVHDHTICTQVSANLALAPASPNPERLPALIPVPRSAAPESPTGTPLDGPHLPRAPPSHPS